MKPKFDKKRLITSVVSAIILIIFMLIVYKYRQNETVSFNETAFVMGTVFQVNLSSAQKGDDPSGELVNIGNRLERNLLSWRLDSSEIAKINASAGKAEGYELSPDMEEILTECLRISAESDGAFDITVGPLTRLWDIDGWASGEKQGEFVPPDKTEIEKALSLCGYDKVEIRDHRIYMQEGMSIDLGAVGKGIYLDKCRDYLDQGNALSGVIVAGGSVLTVGDKKDGTDWNVGITDPFKDGELIGHIEVEPWKSVSTSGSYERFVEYEGMRYHHILDPKTGYPAEKGNASVTIVSQSGLISDALSTACFMLDTEEAVELAERMGAEICIIAEDGTVSGNIKLIKIK
ncbi:FAD:protein FMN transferase [Butyrivibrio sp. WCD3002]|uniref:FAD:protein FMN transferase n=1 Tax=Butyrivibrio sp. WCD3002 TaxID=1280676 RepID=UPI0006889773|nr:FAD:protein FMN transferase [Butyrivibrio sp. WCD3002]